MDPVMYQRILVAIEHSAADRTILDHVTALARLTGGSLVLVHVADGFAARHFNDLKLRESEEIQADRAYLEKVRDELAAAGITAETRLLMGDPASAIVKAVADERADLLAMATHGHRFLEDIVKGSTVDKVRHLVKIPVLLLQQRSAN
jgi:nucleotide-binding universal stress UspA family protein